MRSLFMLAGSCLVLLSCPHAIASQAPSPLADEVGYLLDDGGQWRTPNDDHVADGTTPKQFGLNYRWGPHRQHVIGELVGVFDDGRSVVYSSIYLFHDPSTDRVRLQQAGWDGTYVDGESGPRDGNRRVMVTARHMPDGETVHVRYVQEMIDALTLKSDVYVKDADGQWQKQRTWLWKRVET